MPTSVSLLSQGAMSMFRMYPWWRATPSGRGQKAQEEQRLAVTEYTNWHTSVKGPTRTHPPQADVFRVQCQPCSCQSSCHSCRITQAHIFWHRGILGSFPGHGEASLGGPRTPTGLRSFPKWDAGVLSASPREMGRGPHSSMSWKGTKTACND